MKFKLYFFKEENRIFDRAELFDYLASNSYMTLDTETRNSEKIAIYDNPNLNLKARFIFAEKSAISNIQAISANFYDLNITFEIDLLYPDYKLDKMLNIVEVICKRYRFFVYNETFSNALPFKRSAILMVYQKLKQGYKEKNEEEFMQYAKINSDDLYKVYSYIESKDNLEKNYAEYNAIPLNYEFFKRPGSRTAFLATRWDGMDPFIVPANTQIFIYDDGNVTKTIKFDDLINNIKHLLTILNDVYVTTYMLNPKYTKKVRKHILKTKYIEMQVNLKEVNFDQIMDL